MVRERTKSQREKVVRLDTTKYDEFCGAEARSDHNLSSREGSEEDRARPLPPCQIWIIGQFGAAFRIQISSPPSGTRYLLHFLRRSSLVRPAQEKPIKGEADSQVKRFVFKARFHPFSLPFRICICILCDAILKRFSVRRTFKGMNPLNWL